MSITVPHPETGEPVEVFVRESNGYIDAICRADTKEAFEAAALEQNLLAEDGGVLRPVEGANIDRIGPVVLTPAVLDEAGEVVTPAVIDERYHVNLRLRPDLTWRELAIEWALNGEPDDQINKAEEARVLASVALIDPDTISTPERVWAVTP